MVSEVTERFDRVRRDAPNRPLIVRAATGQVITADALASLASSLEGMLRQAGTAPGQPLLSVAGNTPIAAGLLLACRRIGIPLLPVDKGASPIEIASIAARFGARLVVAGSASVASASGLPLDDGLHLFVLDDRAPAGNPAWTETAVMKLTSGSTGLPRATLTTDANLVADTLAIVEAMDIGPDDRQLAAIPLSHAYGLGNVLVPALIQGTPIVVRDGFVPHQFTQDGERFGVTVFPGVPFMFDHLLQHLAGDTWPRPVARLMSAGARLEADTVQRFHEKFHLKIHSFYGSSESGGICYDDTTVVDAEPTVGRPLPRVTVTLRPEDGAPPDGGRVHVAGPAVSPGYAGEGGEGSGEESPFVDGGFLTGDLGRFDARKHLELHGRVSSFVNVAGRKVQPLEVEAVLRGAPGVSDVRVLGVPDALRGQQLVACVVMEGGTAQTGASLRAHCVTRLAPFKIPRRFLFLDGIPLTERGKTDRNRLDALVSEHLSATR